MSELSGARVLITGASRGIGLELARRFATVGAVPALVARDESAICAVAAEVGGTAHPCDLTDRTAVASITAEIEEQIGPIDVLVNNAGVVHSESVLCQSAREMRRMIELNLSTPVELCRQVVPGMVARGRGHVVTISSIGSTAVFPGLAVYSATKAGLAHFNAGLRADLRGLPVRTTLVELGPVPTEALHAATQFPPAAASYRRAYRNHLLVDVPLATAADRIVRGVERNARTVRIPRRTAPMGAFVEAPRRLTELFLTGIRHQAVPTTAATDGDRQA